MALRTMHIQKTDKPKRVGTYKLAKAVARMCIEDTWHSAKVAAIDGAVYSAIVAMWAAGKTIAGTRRAIKKAFAGEEPIVERAP